MELCDIHYGGDKKEESNIPDFQNLIIQWSKPLSLESVLKM